MSEQRIIPKETLNLVRIAGAGIKYGFPVLVLDSLWGNEKCIRLEGKDDLLIITTIGDIQQQLRVRYVSRGAMVEAEGAILISSPQSLLHSQSFSNWVLRKRLEHLDVAQSSALLLRVVESVLIEEIQ